MQIILLSGGSGMRLWPLSNESRSKQFLKLLPPPSEGGQSESMIQRVVRQIRETLKDVDITVATSVSQKDAVITQLTDVSIVTEPTRRKTFPAVCLAAEYLLKERHCNPSETVIIVPCDTFAPTEYFATFAKMARAVANDMASLVLMGVNPTYPSAKYGYIEYDAGGVEENVHKVIRFIEKPDVKTARTLIDSGALWNGGVYSCRLQYLISLAEKYADAGTFAGCVDKYGSYPAISFDCEVAEKATDMAVCLYAGEWKDLGTWNTLTDVLPKRDYGNIIIDDTSTNTHIINELEIPMLCLGTSNLIVAASPDGILISEKCKSEHIKAYSERLKARPMYEERRWGSYKVINTVTFPDGFCSLTKQLTLNPGCSISYQRHSFRDEVWTFIDGEGEMVINGERCKVSRGDTVTIEKGTMHALKATTSLTFIEVQRGSNLVEEDIERFPYQW